MKGNPQPSNSVSKSSKTLFYAALKKKRGKVTAAPEQPAVSLHLMACARKRALVSVDFDAPQQMQHSMLDSVDAGDIVNSDGEFAPRDFNSQSS